MSSKQRGPAREAVVRQDRYVVKEFQAFQLM